MSDEKEMLEKIYRRHYLTVYRLALAKCGGRQENANDIFGDVFLQLAKYLKKGNRFNDENHEKAWLIRVTLNCSKVIFRTYCRFGEAAEEKVYYLPDSERQPLRLLGNPVMVTIIYLLLGCFCNAWHPGWLVFLLIPILNSMRR